MSGVSFTPKVSVNSAAIKQRINGKANKVQAEFDSLVLADSNYFCPIKTGDLQKSAIINSQLGTGVIKWGDKWRTPYARKMYYDYPKNRPPYELNPNCCGKWFEAAKARWLSKWEKFVNDRIKRS